MNLFTKKTSLLVIVCLFASLCKGQLVVNNAPNALALAQRLVGDGVTISNVTFTGNILMAGFFSNSNNPQPGLDSGIVLTSGRAKTQGSNFGLNGNSFTPASSVLASNSWNLTGDANLATAIGVPANQLHDACVLEFDFVPLGDSVKFRYTFSSEEYEPDFACSEFNDAFAFFISGPGIVGLQNIALIPSTILPVSMANINNVFDGGPTALCPNNPTYYLDNTANTYFTHEGLTKVLTALSRVQPCEVYHLKLVIADNTDWSWDSGVFLEAKSLTSNSFQLTNLTQTDAVGESYLVEGCAVGALKIRRQASTLFSQTIDLGYGGTALNGIDVQTLPSSVVIPANETEVLLNIFPIIDNMPEGIETLKIYTLAPCGVATPTDSATIQIRDYDTLGISVAGNPADSAIICLGGSVQLTATNVYSNYYWDANPGLSNVLIQNPMATPFADSTLFYCTAQEGTCHARDSVFIYWKRLKLVSKVDVNCKDAATGQITVSLSPATAWTSPVTYSINNGPAQASNIFTGLPVGIYTIRGYDGSGCMDSVVVEIVQAFPDLLIVSAESRNGSCTGGADGGITVDAIGGKAPLQYSVDGITFQAGNTFTLAPGTYTVTVKDNNGCTNTRSGIVIGFDNIMTLATVPVPTICEGKSTTISAITNGLSVLWSPSATLDNAGSFTPVASPTVTTKYYVIATLGICEKLDSLTVSVFPAPVANAGKDSTICFGASIRLLGSGGVDYAWSPSNFLSNTNSNNPLSTKPVTITYNLSVTDANGCKSLATDAVVVTVSPPAKLFGGRDTAVAINQPLQLSAIDINHIGFTQYHWTPERGLNNPFIPNPIATYSDATTMLIVTASTINNCEGIDTIFVKTYKGPEIYVANSFTPNGDGLNDVLKAFPVGIETFNYFRIFNRYGELVFATANANTGWDGKLKGALQSMSTFVWIAEGIDYKGKLVQRKGTTTIIQ